MKKKPKQFWNKCIKFILILDVWLLGLYADLQTPEEWYLLDTLYIIISIMCGISARLVYDEVW